MAPGSQKCAGAMADLLSAPAKMNLAIHAKFALRLGGTPYFQRESYSFRDQSFSATVRIGVHRYALLQG